MQTKETLECETDEDCGKTITHCCGCSCPVPVNTTAMEVYTEEAQQACKGYTGTCCARVCPPTKPTCLKGKCSLEPLPPEKVQPLPAFR